jgi:hypothetical protein
MSFYNNKAKNAASLKISTVHKMIAIIENNKFCNEYAEDLAGSIWIRYIGMTID